MQERGAGRGWWARRWPWVVVYALLLVASHATQVVSPNVWIPPADETGQKFVDVPETTRDGVVPGATMHVAYLEWMPEEPVEGREPVLLLHGSPGQGFDYARLGPELAAAGYRAIAVDLPGFGNSTGLVKSYSNRAHARAMLFVMDRLGIPQAHVVGWSNGGGVGLNMADVAPGRLASLTLLAGTGVQETEGSGNFWFERGKYVLGYAAIVIAPEAIPHFGLIGERKVRHAFMRSFLDTDQRPVRGIMERLRVPTMVLHGRDDVLVPFSGAVEHHQLIKTSRLVVLDANHFLPFLQTEETAEHLVDFFARHDVPGVAAESDIIDLSEGPSRLDEMLEKPAVALRKAPWWIEVCLIAALSLASWPLVLASVAILVSTMSLDFGVALLGLLVGRAARARPGVSARSWFSLVWQFSLGLLAARAIAPYVVEPMGEVAGWPGMFAGVGIVAAGLWAIPKSMTWRGRAEIKATLSRARHHEYWPAWAFYAPLIPYLLWQSVRARGAMVWTCCNPGVGHGGGIVGESKSEILASMHDEAVLAHALILPERDVAMRAARAIELIEAEGTGGDGGGLGGYPVILKPDSGQRGFAVKLARSRADVLRYFEEVSGPVVVQRYHAGPHECGILWVRGLRARDSERSAALAGGIFAVTRKDFAIIEGDGERTLERLILDHPRYRCQASVFLARFTEARTWVPASGELVRLAEAGNHCQGTLFRDGADLITPELEAKIDAIASSFSGPGGGAFDFGRFDVRFESEDALRRGEGLGIVELNGVLSEATNLYDPARGARWAYAVLFGQWRELYRIGAMRRDAGARPLGPLEAIMLVRQHFRARTGSSLAD